MLSFLPSISYQEMLLILVVGLLLYGRNLPEAGRALGRAAAQLRRGWLEFKDQLDRDGDMRDVKKSLQGTAEELRRVAAVPRAMADPQRAMRDLATDVMSSPAPPEEPASTPADTPADGGRAAGTHGRDDETRIPH